MRNGEWKWQAADYFAIRNFQVRYCQSTSSGTTPRQQHRRQTSTTQQPQRKASVNYHWSYESSVKMSSRFTIAQYCSIARCWQPIVCSQHFYPAEYVRGVCMMKWIQTLCTILLVFLKNRADDCSSYYRIKVVIFSEDQVAKQTDRTPVADTSW